MKVKSMARKNTTTKQKIHKYRYAILAGAMFLVIGLSGNLFYEDDVIQHNSSCASATYSADNPGVCP